MSFIGCDSAIACWEAAGLYHKIVAHIPHASDFTDLFFRLLCGEDQQVQHKCAMVLWCLWRRRNDKLWKNEETDVTNSVILAMNVLSDWEPAKQGHGTIRPAQNRENDIRWKKPIEGSLKINVDAALFNDINHFGIGICVRNYLGEFVHAKTICIPGVVPAMEAEARGLWEALVWIGGLGYQNIFTKLNCKAVVDGLEGDSNCETETGTILRNCWEQETS